MSEILPQTSQVCALAWCRSAKSALPTKMPSASTYTGAPPMRPTWRRLGPARLAFAGVGWSLVGSWLLDKPHKPWQVFGGLMILVDGWLMVSSKCLRILEVNTGWLVDWSILDAHGRRRCLINDATRGFLIAGSTPNHRISIIFGINNRRRASPFSETPLNQGVIQK